MARHYSNFIQAFVKKHADGYVPNKFFLWTAIGVVAAALERKVWLPWALHYDEYPNMYIFLVSRPGIGKSSAIRPATKMLRDLNKNYARHIRILPSKVTEPKLLDILGEEYLFEYDGKWLKHTSVFYPASEASACFHDPYGGFAQTITALYDGDDIEKATVSRKNIVTISNPCVNIVAGCTFSYLDRLLTTEGVLGGFASRITYVVHNEELDRKSSWQGRNEKKDASINYDHLLKDLAAINKMQGPFTAEEDFAKAWEEWFPQFDRQQQNAPNEKIQSLLVRKQTAVKKLSMILSAAESNDRVLKRHHWDMAIRLLDEVEDTLPDMIHKGKSNQTGTQEGINSGVVSILKNGPMRQQDIVGKLMAVGHDPEKVKKTLETMMARNDLLIKGAKLSLVGDGDAYL